MNFNWIEIDDDYWEAKTSLGLVALHCVEEGWGDEFEEWDICINDCWQGPFDSRYDCIQHLKVCIKEHEEEQSQ